MGCTAMCEWHPCRRDEAEQDSTDNWLLATLLAEGDVGPHLVVAPSSVLENWRREFERWCPALRVLGYIGSESSVIACEGVRSVDHELRSCCPTASSRRAPTRPREQPLALEEFREGYLVLDEAQQIEMESATRAWRSCAAPIADWYARRELEKGCLRCLASSFLTYLMRALVAT